MAGGDRAWVIEACILKAVPLEPHHLKLGTGANSAGAPTIRPGMLHSYSHGFLVRCWWLPRGFPREDSRLHAQGRVEMSRTECPRAASAKGTQEIRGKDPGFLTHPPSSGTTWRWILHCLPEVHRGSEPWLLTSRCQDGLKYARPLLWKTLTRENREGGGKARRAPWFLSGWRE